MNCEKRFQLNGTIQNKAAVTLIILSCFQTIIEISIFHIRHSFLLLLILMVQ